MKSRKAVWLVVVILILGAANHWRERWAKSTKADASLATGVIAPPSTPAVETDCFRLARANDVEGVRRMVDAGLPISKTTTSGVSILSTAIEAEAWNVANYCVDGGFDAKVTCRKATGETGYAGDLALYWASRLGRTDIVRKLLALGARPDGPDPLTSPLAVAVSNSHHEVISLLVANGAKTEGMFGTGIPEPGKGGKRLEFIQSDTLICMPLRRQDLATLELLLGMGIKYDEPGSPVLFRAVEINWPDGVSALIAAGFDPTLPFPLNGKPIETLTTDPAMKRLLSGAKAAQQFLRSSEPAAAKKEAARLVQLIYGSPDEKLSRDLTTAPLAIFRLQDNLGWPLLLHAINASNLAAVQIIINRGARADFFTSEGISPIGLAVQSGNLSILEFLTAKGASLDFCAETGLPPLSIAVKRHDQAILEWLISHGARVNPPRKSAASPLMTAVLEGDEIVTKRLLGAGANPLETNVHGWPVIFFAASGKKPVLVKLLEERGANLKNSTRNAGKILIAEIQQRRLVSARTLLELGVPVPPDALQFAAGNSEMISLLNEYAPRNGNLKLHESTFWPRLSIYTDQEAVALLADGGNPNFRSTETALQSAVGLGRVEIVELLLKREADPNQTGIENKLPVLFIALSAERFTKPALSDEDRLKLIRILVEHGADLEARKPAFDDNLHYAGQTALLNSILRGSIGATRLLLDFGADVLAQDDSGRTAQNYLEIGNNYSDDSRKLIQTWLGVEYAKQSERAAKKVKPKNIRM